MWLCHKKICFYLFFVALLVTSNWIGLMPMVPPKTVNQVDLIIKPSPSSSTMRLVWLASFPNSGTSYTMQLVRRATHTLTASNYGNEIRGNTSSYVFDENGPFWNEPHYHASYSKPQKFVLTKTHCGGRCMDCSPKAYVKTRKSFQEACILSRRQDYVNGRKIFTNVKYNISLVSRAIHLIRDPFDNVVSRFHHFLTTTDSFYNRTRNDFRKYCFQLNEKYRKVEDRWNVTSLLNNVPCRSDFVRYAQWHNLAFELLERRLDIPVLVLHYESYASAFESTVTSLLDFLELSMVSNPPSFVLGKQYRDYFTAEERIQIRSALYQLSSPSTWNVIERYFVGTL